MNDRPRLDVAACVPDQGGESPCYDSAGGRLLWVDIFAGLVRELTSPAPSHWQLGRTWRVGQVAAAVVPVAKGGFLAATRTDFVTVSDEGEMAVVASLDSRHGESVRLNDAKCDARGRLVAGWMSEDAGHRGGLLCLEPDGGVRTILTGTELANGLDWSPDGTTFYFVDSAARRVDAFDYDDATGTISDRRNVVTIEPGVGAPNGMTTDQAGNLWVTVTYAGEVRCYAPEGRLVDVITTPTPRPTSCAFGGPDGDDLFITSTSVMSSPGVLAKLGLGSERIEAAQKDRHGGTLFVCRPGVPGRMARPFAA